MFERLRKLRERRLAWRLIGYLGIAVLSIVVPLTTLVATLQYHEARHDLEENFSRIAQSQSGNLAQAAWVNDRDYLELAVSGIVRLAYFEFAEVRDDKGAVLASAGERPDAKGITHTYRLEYVFRGKPMDIGSLTISASLGELRRAMARDMGFGLLTVAGIVLAVGVAIYGIVDRRITRQVEALAARARSLGDRGLQEPAASAPVAALPPSPDELGELVRSFDAMQSSLAEAHGRLLASERRYRSLFASLPVSAWEEDFSAVKARLDALRGEVRDFPAHLEANPRFVREAARLVRVLAVNDATVDLHRADSAGMLLNGIAQTFTPSSLAAFREELVAIWEGRTSLAAEATVKTLDGETRDVLVYWRAVSGHEATYDRIIVSLLDVTDRRRAEKRLARTVEELTLSNRELQEFARITAHDLREPVRSIVSYAQLFGTRYVPPGDADGQEIVGTVVAAAKHLDAVVRALSDYTGISAHAQTFGPVDAGQAASRAAASLRREIEAAGATVEIGPLPVVSGNEKWLTQLFGHLLDNALEFRSAERPPRIAVNAEPRGEAWLFSVTDNGIGIDPAYAEQVFALFKRLEPNRKPGTGVSLAICRRIVEHHGGRIWVEPAAGGGSVFRFTLRAAEESGLPA
jgi:signal transduction histidine kinase